MAQLPPKIPPISPIWYPFSHQTMSNYVSSTTTAATSTTAVVDNNNPSWVDEFLDFTSTKRGVYRRSISDSIAFLETNIKPLVEECHHDNNNNNNNNNSSNGLMSENLGFDRLDDEQLMSMFSDDMSLSLLPSTSNSSTPSDQNSNNDEKPTMVVDQQHQQPQQRQQHQQQATKTEPGEVESSCKQEPQQQHFSSNPYGDPIITDPKRVKRILANRQSAQRSRVRKLQYISELELSVTTLQTEVSALSPRVAFLDHQRMILNVDNSALKQRIAALAQDKIFKDAHQEALKNEIERLMQVYHQQNLQKMNNNNGNAVPLPPRNETQRTDKEELLMS